MTYRQEVFNVILAQLLQERGVISAPENIIKAGPDFSRRMPDILVNFNGLRLIIEGEIGDSAESRNKAINSARARVEEGLAHIAIAVIYPEELQSYSFAELKDKFSQSDLLVAIASETGVPEFIETGVNNLSGHLNAAFEQLIQEDVVARAVLAIDNGVEQFAYAVMTRPGVSKRLADVLGIRDWQKETARRKDEE